MKSKDAYLFHRRKTRREKSKPSTRESFQKEVVANTKISCDIQELKNGNTISTFNKDQGQLPLARAQPRGHTWLKRLTEEFPEYFNVPLVITQNNHKVAEELHSCKCLSFFISSSLFRLMFLEFYYFVGLKICVTYVL